MADKKIHLQIITPTGIKLEEHADMVIMRCTTGDLGVLYGHEARSAILDLGVLRLINDGYENRLAVFGGMVEIKDNKITIITSLAELPQEIDRSRAEADLEWADRLIHEGKNDVEMQQGHVRARRSMVRIEVSSYPLLTAQSHTDHE
jgi:F-type H+-transporting ATPase subunit epsilon